MAPSGFLRSNEEARLNETSTTTAAAGQAEIGAAERGRLGRGDRHRERHHERAARQQRRQRVGGEGGGHPGVVDEARPGAPIGRGPGSSHTQKPTMRRLRTTGAAAAQHQRQQRRIEVQHQRRAGGWPGAGRLG